MIDLITSILLCKLTEKKYLLQHQLVRLLLARCTQTVQHFLRYASREQACVRNSAAGMKPQRPELVVNVPLSSTVEFSERPLNRGRDFHSPLDRLNSDPPSDWSLTAVLSIFLQRMIFCLACMI